MWLLSSFLLDTILFRTRFHQFNMIWIWSIVRCFLSFCRRDLMTQQIDWVLRDLFEKKHAEWYSFFSTEKTRFNCRPLRQPLPIFIHNTSFHFRGGHPYLWKDLPTAISTSNEYEYFLVLILKLVIKKPDPTTDRQAAESAPYSAQQLYKMQILDLLENIGFTRLDSKSAITTTRLFNIFWWIYISTNSSIPRDC